ncbi:MAG: flavodoxin family protein [Ancrocorticia sp.]|uniref:flavodoxin family protein n=1 Tax=Ancrocorticia sp. TaxID=2593684 RepID=UPI003F8EE3B8
MKVSVIVESCFGNTMRVAQAIRSGLEEAGAKVTVMDVATAPVAPAGDLVVIAGPTHNMGMSSAKTRAQARQKGADHAPAIGVREWISTLQSVSGQVVTASTTTGGSVAGSAGKAMYKALKRKKIAARQGEDFRVNGTSGPLADGELARARAWGSRLAE